MGIYEFLQNESNQIVKNNLQALQMKLKVLSLQVILHYYECKLCVEMGQRSTEYTEKEAGAGNEARSKNLIGNYDKFNSNEKESVPSVVHWAAYMCEAVR